MSLVVFTGFAGLLDAPGDAASPARGRAPCSASRSAPGRPAPSTCGTTGTSTRSWSARAGGRSRRAGWRPAEALAFGVVLSLLSVMLMGLAVNWTAAALLALANGFYVFVYTVWLKRRTPQNIVIGGAAGAFPPMIGWAAVTGAVSLESIVLFLIIFIWTPPHFWAWRSTARATTPGPACPCCRSSPAARRPAPDPALQPAALPLAAAWRRLHRASPARLWPRVAAALGGLLVALAFRVWRRATATGRRGSSSASRFSISSRSSRMLIVDRANAAPDRRPWS